MAKKDNKTVYYMLVGLLVVFAIFLGFSLLMRSKILSPSSEEGFQDGSKTIHYRLFYTDWCPHCTSTKPEWKKMKDAWESAKRELYWENNKLSYKDINIEAVNCEADKNQCKELQIQGYPTIILSIGDKHIEYDEGGRSHADLMSFLETKLQENDVTYGQA